MLDNYIIITMHSPILPLPVILQQKHILHMQEGNPNHTIIIMVDLNITMDNRDSANRMVTAR